ncbi:hypothetical protein A3D09_01090 [Candidatus Collierbacteria bacterium RIFCSPHIGHO2_02_FULL_49_10]|uniref:N-acetyltransferase domain-containing protein n=2 Tax=Candidatus Collieribacteriota TaxID=1752725 RepID=A0A1F5EVN8_9BACT|nr:MAG: hypothetical protein A3D09_01090 [Candidatus Collierbacteria bacterium RIFCSPHIGHO2_02_FULL_49_10]OGD71442.1 MAG: hypothetical protein A2703_02985 [Candidatus Collierbacteria bacterium RIFCSPHIGHO2_01_FULL_50_25]
MVDLRKVDPSKANLDHEKSRLRHLNPKDPEEKKRLWKIETDPRVVKFVENICQTDDDLADFATLEKDYLVLAIEGKAGHVDEAEVGKLQGWVVVCPEEKKRLARLQKHGLADLAKQGLRVLEIGFARHPKAKSGQMASALRQVLAFLQTEHTKDGEVQLVITAYTDEANEASTRVLLASGFLQMGKVKYHVRNAGHDNFFIWQK